MPGDVPQEVEDCVKAIKREGGKGVDNPWAVCWAQYNKRKATGKLESKEYTHPIPQHLITQFESKGHSDPEAAAKRVTSALEACNLSTFQSFKRAGLNDEEARKKAAEKCKSEASKMDLLL